MDVKKELLTVNKYSRPSKKRSRTTKVAIHYVGNANSSAMANRNYFENLKKQTSSSNGRYASSHYIVGLQGEIIQCVPEDEIAYTTNEANAYSIGIEVCHPKSDGVFSEVTRKALIELVADICKRYNLNPINDIIRHYDITGKSCPLCWASNSGSKYQDFNKFKNQVKDFMTKDKYEVIKVKINVFGELRNVNAINIDGSNYIKLRDLACDKIKVEWNGNVLVNGKVFKGESVLHEGFNYTKVRELESIGFKIGWDEKAKIVTID